MHQNLTLVERAEVRWAWIAQLYDAKQLVVDGIGHRDRVRKLLRRVDTVMVADGNVGVAGGARRLPGHGD